MTITHEERPSDSPYVETVTRGRTVGDGSTIRPAESRWHMVSVRHDGGARMIVVGPWTTAGVASWKEGAEIVWIRFELGAFMPHLSARDFLDTETVLPEATSGSFWLKGSAWRFPEHDDVETFVNRLVRNDILVRDPVVDAALQDQQEGLSSRTLRHRFLRATGQSRGHVRQVERAQRAATLLRQGRPISDAVHEAGYFDQPHLTRSLKRWVGHTPAQIVRSGGPERLAVSYKKGF
jgi:AraC-like DNA-binding protein